MAAAPLNASRDQMPLAGVRVFLTRRTEDSGPVARLLEGLGAEVGCIPLISITAVPEAARPVADALAGLSPGDWLVFSSPNAVRTFPHQGPLPAGVWVASMGPGTTREAAAKGWAVDLESGLNTAEGLGLALSKQVPPDRRNCRVLVPHSDLAGDRLPDVLTSHGFSTVQSLTTYRTIRDAASGVELSRRVADAMSTGQTVCVVFASASAVQAMAGAGDRPLDGARIVAIGRTTGDAVAAARLGPCVVAQSPMAGALAHAVCQAVRDSGEAPAE